jgi:hypothetical protein
VAGALALSADVERERRLEMTEQSISGRERPGMWRSSTATGRCLNRPGPLVRCVIGSLWVVAGLRRLSDGMLYCNVGIRMLIVVVGIANANGGSRVKQYADACGRRKCFCGRCFFYRLHVLLAS